MNDSPDVSTGNVSTQKWSNTERDGWRDLTPEDATGSELRLIHQISGPKPDWITPENWRDNMRACARDIREHVMTVSTQKALPVEAKEGDLG